MAVRKVDARVVWKVDARVVVMAINKTTELVSRECLLLSVGVDRKPERMVGW